MHRMFAYFTNNIITVLTDPGPLRLKLIHICLVLVTSRSSQGRIHKIILKIHPPLDHATIQHCSTGQHCHLQTSRYDDSQTCRYSHCMYVKCNRGLLTRKMNSAEMSLQQLKSIICCCQTHSLKVKQGLRIYTAQKN